MIRFIARMTGLMLIGILAACSTQNPNDQVTRQNMAPLALPAMKTPAGRAAPASNRSNQSIARDFMLLAFQLESGRPLPVLSRFEGPVTLRVTGNAIRPVSMRDLGHLISRLQTEAHIPISQVDSGAEANLTIEFIKQRTLRRVVPQAACFVAPGVSSWQEFTSGRARAGQDWTSLTTRSKMAVFLPSDVSPQEIRDCLHEEIAQALGPVNDLYHLTDSIFNDDNFHTVLTGFDMLILRAFYDRQLQSGMAPDSVAARLPAILNRIHPRGRGGSLPALSPTPRSWSDEIKAALGSERSGSAKIAAAKRAVAIARAQGWRDNRLGFSLFALGRLALSQNSNLALNAFAEADAIFLASPETRLHAAHLSVQSAAFALSAGRPEAAIQIADENSAVALRAENPNLLSTLLMIKAAALEAAGRSAQGDIVRLDSLGWARYGLGTAEEIRDRLREISALAPRRQEENSL